MNGSKPARASQSEEIISLNSAPGIYFITIKAAGKQAVKKIAVR